MAVLVKKRKKVKRKPQTPTGGVRWNQKNKPDGPLSVAERNKLLEEWLAVYPQPIALMIDQWPQLVRGVMSGSEAVDAAEVNQMCLYGAVRAARLFDPARGLKFSTYAEWHMRSILTHHLRKAAYRVKCLNGGWVRSLDATIRSGDDETLAGTIPDHREADRSGLPPADDLRRMVADVVNRRVPGERDRAIIRQRWGLDGEPPRTLQEVGDTFGVTRERIRQIEVRVLRRVREAMAGVQDGVDRQTSRC